MFDAEEGVRGDGQPSAREPPPAPSLVRRGDLLTEGKTSARVGVIRLAARVLDSMRKFTAPLALAAVLFVPLVFVAAGSAAGSRVDRAKLAKVPAEAVAPARLEQISRRYLGTPYQLDALGEGSGLDADPVFTRKCVDCQTLVEQVMTEALAPYTDGMEAAGRIVRYHNQEVRFENRYHFCIPDWLENPWPAQDITREVGGKRVEEATRTIDLPKLITGRGGETSAAPHPLRQVTSPYIPRAEIEKVTDKIPDGSIALIASSNPIVVIGHCGFLFRKGDTVMLRHASQRKKEVIEQPLLEYFESAPKSFIGLKVLKSDVAGLRR